MIPEVILHSHSFYIIDDDADDRYLLRRILEQLGIVRILNESVNAEVAIACLQQMEALPEYIFVDLNMPTMSGHSFLTVIKDEPRLKQIPVIVYSTSNYHKDIAAARALGAASYLIKPVDVNQLPGLILEALREIAIADKIVR